MPSLFSSLLATCGSFLFGKIPLHLPIWLQFILGTAVWLVIFIYSKRVLNELRP